MVAVRGRSSAAALRLTPGDDATVVRRRPRAAVEFEYDAKSKDQIRELFFRRLYCPEGQYSRYGQLFFTPLSKSLKLLVHLGELGEGATATSSTSAWTRSRCIFVSCTV